MGYRKLSTPETVDLVSYVKEYIQNHHDVEILIGCDSQNRSSKTVYAIVVALYHRGKGAHIIFNRFLLPRERVIAVRLLNEVWYAVEVAEELKAAGVDVIKYIDIDLNPDPKYKSNSVFRQAVGLVEGMGYQCRFKTLGPIATYAADHLVKE